MTGSELAELMKDKALKHAIAKHARRYSRIVENQEDYIQGAWLRISREENGLSLSDYSYVAAKSIQAQYRSNRRAEGLDVYKKQPLDVHGNSKREVRDPRKYVAIERGRWIVRQPETLDEWYYDGEWRDWVYFFVIENGKRRHKFTLRHDAENNGIYPFYTIDKTHSKKYRFHPIEVPREAIGSQK